MRLLLTIYSYNIATLKFQRPTSILKKADWGKLTINEYLHNLCSEGSST